MVVYEVYDVLGSNAICDWRSFRRELLLPSSVPLKPWQRSPVLHCTKKAENHNLVISRSTYSI